MNVCCVDSEWLMGFARRCANRRCVRYQVTAIESFRRQYMGGAGCWARNRLTQFIHTAVQFYELENPSPT